MNNRTFLTLGQAAKEVGKSKATISQYIKNGKLSVYAKTDKGYQIDPAELFRVFEPVQDKPVNDTQNKTPDMAQFYSEKVQLLERIIADKDNVINDLKTRLDNESQERKRLTLILVDEQYRLKKKWWQFWKKAPTDPPESI